MSGSLSAGEIRRRCDALAQAVLGWCGSRGMRIAAAESLTGGLLADAFVRIPGASRVFLGSAVTYDIAAKASVLGVDADLLRREGAVHPDVARQMALGTARLYDQPAYGGRVIGLSTTGVARRTGVCGVFGTIVRCRGRPADHDVGAVDALGRPRADPVADGVARSGKCERIHSGFTGIIPRLRCCS